MAKVTNYLLTVCYQTDSDTEAIVMASKVAKATKEWVQVDFRGYMRERFASVGPEGEVLLSTKRKA